MNISITRKLLVFAILSCIAQSASAVAIELKNIYAQVEAVPSEAGQVYISTRSDQVSYMKESTGWGSVSSMKATLERNGDDPDGATMYETIVKARPAEGYEFVCYSYEPSFNDGIFLAADIYREASSTNGDTRTWTYATAPMGVNGTGAIVNVTSPLRNDGNTDNPGKDKLLKEGIWSATPDRYIYAIFRKVGESYPMLDELLPVDRIVVTPKIENNKVYNTAGQVVVDDYKGIVIINGKKYLRK